MEPFLFLLETIWDSFLIFLQSLRSGAAFFPSMEAAFTALFPALQGVVSGLLPVVLGILVGILSLAFFGFFAPNFIVGYIIYTMHLKRTKKSKWTRECSCDDPPQVAMYGEGLAWSEQFGECKKDVHIISEGLNLYGEFYDFGSDKTAILVAGRTEGLRYCYYFARPYQESGFNILTIDNRAHGESDGKYNTVGFEEHKDLLNWAKYLRENHHTEQIVFHGICIGSAGSLYALTSDSCPDYIQGIVADGMYPNFRESFRNHMIELKKPMFGLPFIEWWMKALTGHAMKYGPIDVIDRLDCPILMLHGTNDLYSLPSEAEKLYAKCGSKQKKLVWFEGGSHSLLRYADAEKYDAAIKEFLRENWTDKDSAA
ncbi:MAG: alpha/beta fold hydrolase [Clostridia bacterium]|nr:alpha/beta fold hydrolase [Clostridia bacterium]